MAIVSSITSVARTWIGLALIFLFAFAVTPVVLLHDMFANHKDVSYNNPYCNDVQVAKASINCHCISLIAEPHFTDIIPHYFLASPRPVTIGYSTFLSRHFYSQHHFLAELRGPPSEA